MDIVEQDGKCYFPYNVVANLLFLHYYNDVVYNGIDFYLSNTITTDTDSMTYSSYYASEGNFTFMKMFMHPYPANDGEAYRFVYADPRYGDYFVINLLEGGTGYGFYALSPDMTFDEREKNYAYYTFDWYGDEYGAFADVNLVSDKPGVGKYFGYIKIPFEVGYSGNKRSPSLIKYNYNVLKFQFENLYGLRAEKGYTDFEDAVEKAGVKEGLMSDDAFEYDYAIAKFVCGYIDDFHSWMDIRCAFWNAADKVYLASYEYEVFGEKYNRVWETKFYYYDVRSQVLSDKYGLNSDEELGLFFEGNTAVIRFDVFKAQNMKNEYVDCTFDELKDVVLSSTNIFVDNCFKFISENPQIENVVFDLSGCNGGAIWLCPYIAAYFTSDPYRLEENTLTGEIMELHYTVDINHDGVYGGVGDTYEGKYNFFLLTSEGTFSAGTLFAGFAREAGVTIIGKPTAGGAGDPLGYADACGSCHVTTGALKQVYYDNGKYISADYGVPIDYELDVEYWYDLSELVAFINGIK